MKHNEITISQSNLCEENLLNQQILDSILDDDEKLFTQTISKLEDISLPNKIFTMTNYKMPKMLQSSPSYASVCAFFSAEKCFSSLLLLAPGGLQSEEMKKSDNYKRSLIHFAAAGGSLNLIRELDQAGFNLSQMDVNGNMPSHYAAMMGHFDIIKYLWTKGADIFSQSLVFNKTKTPLHVACLYGHLKIVKFFCEVSISSEKYSTFILKNFDKPYNLVTPMHYACMGGHADIVDYFLDKKELLNYQLNKIDKYSCTPLICACENGSISCVKLLFEKAKSDLNLDVKGRKRLPLIEASAAGQLDIVKFLLSNKEIDIYLENSLKITAIEAAVIADRFEITKCLVENGAVRYYNERQIVKLFFEACKTQDMKLIHYFDEKLNIPYSKPIESPLKESFLKNLVNKSDLADCTYGDKFMQESCVLRNEEMVEFFLSKNCSFKYVDIFDLLFETPPFLDFLIEKGYDITCQSYPPKFTIPITYIISVGNVNQIQEVISKGAILNAEIISKYNCIQKVCNFGNIETLDFLMSFNPDFSDSNAYNCISTLFSRFMNLRNKKASKSKKECLVMLDKILSIKSIDFNDTFITKSSIIIDTFITFAIEIFSFDILELFKNHGADFTHCSLNFNKMVTKEFLPFYNYLGNLGCKFDKELDERNASIKSSYVSNPINSVMRCFLLPDFDVNILIFLIDYSSPEQLLNARVDDKNIIDVLLYFNYLDAILKVYQKTKAVSFPLQISVHDYIKYINENNQEQLKQILNTYSEN